MQIELTKPICGLRQQHFPYPAIEIDTAIFIDFSSSEKPKSLVKMLGERFAFRGTTSSGKIASVGKLTRRSQLGTESVHP